MAANPIVSDPDSNGNLNGTGKLKPSERYQYSPATSLKQKSLTDILRLHMRIVRYTLGRHTWANRTYAYVDMNAGPGEDPEGNLGSPLIAIECAHYERVELAAMFCEKDEQTADQLDAALARYSIDLRAERVDNREVWRVLPGDPRQYGMFYSDPSNAALPWETLSVMSNRYPRMDHLINLACASYKRQVNLPGYEPLRDKLLGVKPFWLIRKPQTQFQWVMLLGSGKPDIKEWKRAEWYRFDTPEGRELFEIATETRADRERRHQLEMF